MWRRQHYERAKWATTTSRGSIRGPPCTRQRPSLRLRSPIHGRRKPRMTTPSPMRQRVVMLRHGLAPITEIVTKKRLGVPITAPDDEEEKTTKAEIQHEACREEPPLDLDKEEDDVALTTTVTKKELPAMRDFSVCDETSIGGEIECYFRPCGSSGLEAQRYATDLCARGAARTPWTRTGPMPAHPFSSASNFRCRSNFRGTTASSSSKSAWRCYTQSSGGYLRSASHRVLPRRM